MDPKILDIIRKIVNEPDKIDQIVAAEGTEYFFWFKGVVFSIMYGPNRSGLGLYSFYVYPNWTQPLEQLAVASARGEEVQVMEFHTGVEGIEAFAELARQLWQTVHGKHINMDTVFKRVLEE